MEQPQVNSYVDLQIIDCNRQHSVIESQSKEHIFQR